MATITVLEFDTANGADHMLMVLDELQSQRLISIQDAAIVSWPQGAKKPKTDQLTHLASVGALTGAFWGLLFGLLFFMPLLGLAIGAGLGALGGSLRDVGVDDELIEAIRNEVIEGTSALFLLTADAVPDQLAEELKTRNVRFKLLASNLSAEQEARLRDIFGTE
jgi:uncharacterized membrane protein